MILLIVSSLRTVLVLVVTCSLHCRAFLLPIATCHGRSGSARHTSAPLAHLRTATIRSYLFRVRHPARPSSPATF